MNRLTSTLVALALIVCAASASAQSAQDRAATDALKQNVRQHGETIEGDAAAEEAAQAAADTAAAAADAAQTAADAAAQGGRTLYSYVTGGVRYYTNKLPPADATDVRRIPMPVPVPPKSRWQVLFSNDEESWSVDTETLKRTGQTANAWTRIFYTKPQELGKSKGVMSVRGQSDYNCSGRETRLTYVILYGAKGEVLETKSFPYLGPETVIPDTIGEVVYDQICAMQ
ncbi:MAG TPA: surface-adhesin E family protein [Lysobacter sp.]